MECDYPVNSAIAGYLSALTFRFYNKGPIYKRARALEIKFNAKLLKKLGWVKKKDEPPYITSLRSGAVATLGTSGDRQVIAKARKLFRQYTSGGKGNPPTDLKAAVYRIIAYNGGAKELKKFLALYRKSTTAEDERAIYSAMGSFRQPELNRQLLKFSLSKHVRPQDQSIISGYISSNPDGKPLILAWTKRNWKLIRKKFKDNASLIVDFIEALYILQTESELKEVKTFFSSRENYVKEINRALKNTLEYIESNRRFVEYNS
jgi:aminopeptidase N